MKFYCSLSVLIIVFKNKTDDIQNNCLRKTEAVLFVSREIIRGNILNVLNKHAAILKILQCAGCNIKNITVCRLQLLKI